MKMTSKFQTLARSWSKNYSTWLKIRMKLRKTRNDLFIFGNSTEHFQTQIWNSLKILKNLWLNKTNRRKMKTISNPKIKRTEIMNLLKRLQSFRFFKKVRILIRVVSSKSKNQRKIMKIKVSKRRNKQKQLQSMNKYLRWNQRIRF